MQKQISMAEAAEILGVDVQTVRKRIRDGDLPAHRVGPRLIRIYADDLEKLSQPIGGVA
jgi:excisionase family DNA binding protein